MAVAEGRSEAALRPHVRALERELGTRLVDETDRGVQLTGSGRALLAEARRVLAAADAARAAMARFDERPEPVTVGYTGSAATGLLPTVLDRLRSERPRAAVTLRELTDKRYELLRAGELDVVFGRLRPHEAPDLAVDVLREEGRMVALPAGHRLARARSVAMADLRNEGFITQPEALNPVFRADWLAEQRRHGLPGRIVAEATTIPEYLDLVANGRGVCLVPATASRFHPRPGVAYVLVRDAAPLPVALARRSGEPRPVVAAIAAIAARVAREA